MTDFSSNSSSNSSSSSSSSSYIENWSSSVSSYLKNLSNSSSSSSSYVKNWSSSSSSSSSSSYVINWSSSSSSYIKNWSSSSSSSSSSSYIKNWSSSSSSSDSSNILITRDLNVSFINQGHYDLIPFSWIAEKGTGVVVSNSQLNFIIEAASASSVDYSAVINGNNDVVDNTLLANNSSHTYVPEIIDSKYTHDKSVYIDIIAKDISGIREFRTHVEPNAYEFKNIDDSYTFFIPKFTWSN